MSVEEKSKSPSNKRRGFGGGGGALSRPVEKAKDVKGTLRRLATYLKPKKMKLVFVFIMAIFSTAFGIVSPRIMGKVTTHLFETIKASKEASTRVVFDFVYIRNILLTLVVLYVLSSLFNYFMQFIMASVAQKTVYELRKDVSDKLAKLPLKYYDSKTHGEILSRVTNDIENISTTLQQSITQLITSIITLIGVVVMMLIISPIMTLIALLTLPLSIIFIKNIAKKSQGHFKEQQKKLGELNGHVEEMYTGHKIIKVFGKEKDAIEKFEVINEELYNVGWKAQFISGIIMPVVQFINNIGYVAIVVVGGVFVAGGSIALGDVQAFIQYVRQFGHPIIQTANIANIIQSTIASAERVFEVLDEEEEIEDAETYRTIEKPTGKVIFERVNFSYTEDKKLIENMNISVEEGQKVAIIGPTGAGKTTLVNLLMRFYDIQKGSILIDGINILDISRENLREMFGMVLQDTWLFNGTIRENILYGKATATEEEMCQATRSAHADHFIRTLPEGYDTILNEDATNISQGQKQLITIARAFLVNPPILILDEATSSVDTRTEKIIQKAMEKLMEGRTSFIIAHRLSTIKDADLILVMNEGTIIEKGTHEELMDCNGFYAELYNSQFVAN